MSWLALLLLYSSGGKKKVNRITRTQRCPTQGRRSITRSPANIIFFGRFVFSPISTVDKRLTTETSELKSEVENLGKKLLYLETTHKNSREHIDQIFKSRS